MPTHSNFDSHLAERLPLRILLAEDNRVNQKLTLATLKKFGYAAHVANNGRETVEAVQRHTYDLVLMDVQMPELDGLAATRQIRMLEVGSQGSDSVSRPPAPGPYIIAMTANAMQGDREQCLQAGMDDYLSKPIQVAELRAALERWGEKVRARAVK